MEVADGVTDRDPEVALDPVHAPEAVHEVELFEDQVMVDEAPGAMIVGETERTRVGAGVLPDIIQTTPVISGRSLRTQLEGTMPPATFCVSCSLK